MLYIYICVCVCVCICVSVYENMFIHIHMYMYNIYVNNKLEFNVLNNIIYVNLCYHIMIL